MKLRIQTNTHDLIISPYTGNYLIVGDNGSGKTFLLKVIDFILISFKYKYNWDYRLFLKEDVILEYLKKDIISAYIEINPYLKKYGFIKATLINLNEQQAQTSPVVFNYNDEEGGVLHKHFFFQLNLQKTDFLKNSVRLWNTQDINDKNKVNSILLRARDRFDSDRNRNIGFCNFLNFSGLPSFKKEFSTFNQLRDLNADDFSSLSGAKKKIFFLGCLFFLIYEPEDLIFLDNLLSGLDSVVLNKVLTNLWVGGNDTGIAGLFISATNSDVRYLKKETLEKYSVIKA